MLTKTLRFFAIVCALSLVLVACNTSGDSSSGDSPDKSSGGSEQEGSNSEEPAATAAPYTVGMQTETFVDDSRPTDSVAGFDGAPDRTLPTTIYYPAASGEPGAAPVADAAPAPGPFPFILFSHGVESLGSNYADLLVQWVEAGYVVAAPNYPLGSSDTPGDVAVITDAAQQAIDASFVTDSVLALDGVGPTIDPDHIGAAGHSLGGITTAGFAISNDYRDERVSAAILFAAPPGFDGGVTFDVPLLVEQGDIDTSVPLDLTAIAFEPALPPAFFVTLFGVEHTPAFLGGDDPAAEVVAQTTLDFFDAYLGNDAEAVDTLIEDATVPAVAEIEARV